MPPQIDATLGALYAAMFVVQAGLFVRVGVVQHRLTFTSGNGVAGWVGWAAIGYGLVVYPLIGIAHGHGWPQAPLFGMAPCPSTIVTFGLLLLAAPPLPRHPLVVPTIWAILAPLAAVGHGVLEDLGLAVVGLAAVTIVFLRNRRRRAAAGPTPPDVHPLAPSHA